MKKKDQVSRKIQSLKDDFVNKTIFFLAIILVPVIIAIWMRISYTGVTAASIIIPALLLVLILLYILRSKVSMIAKSSILILSFFLIAISVFSHLGLLSMGASILLCIVALASLYLNGGLILFINILSVLVFAAYGFLWTGGFLEFPGDPGFYLFSRTNWIVQLAGFVALLFMISLSFRNMMGGLQNAIQSEVNSKQQIEEMLKSENQRLESEVDKRTKELEQSTKELIKREQMASLGTLVAGVAHEINTPLGVAITASTYLSDMNKKVQADIAQGGLSKSGLIDFLEKLDETSSMLNRNLFTASDLVKNFKQISVNQSNPMKAKFNLKEHVETLIFTLKHEYKNTPHEIAIDIDAQINLYSFPGSCTQIITNLLMNSLRHAFNDGRSGMILIKGRISENNVVIRFCDNGTGIPAEIINLIYDPFFTTDRGGGGTGLGMSIVYNIVTDKLNGKIECESSDDKGTLFTITVPLEQSEEE